MWFEFVKPVTDIHFAKHEILMNFIVNVRYVRKRQESEFCTKFCTYIYVYIIFKARMILKNWKITN